MKRNETKVLIAILLISLLVRLLIAIFYVSAPDIPHDFYGFIAAADSVKNGTLYTDPVGDGKWPSTYGPMLALTMASWITIFGKSYVLLKIPGILFDVSIIYLIYQIIKRIKNTEAAEYASIFYSFSYLSLWSSSAEGKADNSMFLFFMLLSLFFLIKDNYTLSSISLGISLGYKLIPVVMIFPVFIYLYSTKRLKNATIYLLVTVITFFLILLPFYLKAGSNVFFPYWTTTQITIGGAAILGLVKMLGYYFTFGVEKPYDTYNFPEWVATPVGIVGLIFAITYVFKFRLNDKKMELFRNIFVFIFAGLVFSRNFHSLYVLWLLPIIVLMATYSGKFNNEFSLTHKEVLGILLVIFGAMLHGELYRWLIDYSSTQRGLILLGVVLASIGTYLVMIKTSVKKSWSLLMFGTINGIIIHARVLLLFVSIIPSLSVQRLVVGYTGFATVSLMLAGMFWLFKEVHNTTLVRGIKNPTAF